ncbi:hypothetical protein JVX92_15085 (plasmid) [Microbacterium hominis]|uniref:hypothetical protein n=1 Tax=Microbacterium hominis TaxID=162426 RepID=UPI001963CFB7|nr:hypothetical protein [Microbacterium hominis]QRY42305.1 hypothetical protein JVX92_15085 [Microbacterium hominis]
MTWPVSDTVGPTRVVEGFPVCFEHSPIGAALAATTIAFSLTDHSAESTANFWVIDSPGKSIYVENARAAEAAQGNLIVNGFAAQGATVAGFRIDDYTGDTASVRVVVQVPGSARGYLGGQYTLVWVDGDWRQRVNDLGKTAPAASMFRDEFTHWSSDG